MMRFVELYGKYGNVEPDDFTGIQMEELRQFLPLIKADELITTEDYRLYIDLVQKFRQRGVNDDARNHGERFKELLKQLLTVGEDGVYSDKLRFLFELIQNVDDCEYNDKSDCRLQISFDPQEDKIILEYNEVGFKPKDVFYITGIAEKSKNISVDKIEIGEKGIGFKSVFGIAEEVLIQSGYFSFFLEKDNFTVPIVKYDNFTYFEGTKLTLLIKHEDNRCSKVGEIYREIANRYNNASTLIKKNPILFLNKLTEMQIMIDSYRNINFAVGRTNLENVGNGLVFEQGITISAKFKNIDNGSEKAYEKSIECFKYTTNIVLDRQACISRYGEKTDFNEKHMNITAFLPIPEHARLLANVGTLYSFLPTEIQINSPMVIHAPFKLDASRGYVDPQDENKWFKDTRHALEEFLLKIYYHLSTFIKENLVHYLPFKNEYMFDGNEKVKCLQIDSLSGDRLVKERLFHCIDGNCRSSDEICSFSSSDNIEEPIEAHCLAKVPKPLFLCPTKKQLDRFGINIIEKINNKIFMCGLTDANSSKKCFDYLTKVKFEPTEIVNSTDFSKLEINIETLVTLSNLKDTKIKDSILDIFANKIKELSYRYLPILKESNLSNLAEKYCSLIVETLETDFPEKSKVKAYVTKIKNNFVCLDGVTESFYFPTRDFLALSSIDPLDSFADFAKKIGEKGRFVVSLQMRQATENLDKLVEDNSISNDEFLDELKVQRNGIKKALGSNAYNSFIQFVKKAGADKKRFIKELLQNADDCEFLNGKTPEFSLLSEKNIITIQYNEKGFTRNNIRAITAIGESNKKLIFGTDTTGEKGVGFKSVFNVADEVKIFSSGDSGSFAFSLSADSPTVPVKIKEINNVIGTQMVFSLNEKTTDYLIDKEDIIQLCFCLRKLKTIRIGDTKIQISDTNEERIISISNEDGKSDTIVFRKFEHNFTIDNKDAVAERSDKKYAISPEQKANIYIPIKRDAVKSYFVYCGLPTTIKTTTPILIDAPFELTTSRDDIVQNKWNNIIREEVLIMLANALDLLKKKERISLLDFIPEDGKLFDKEYLNQSSLLEKLKLNSILPLVNGGFGKPFNMEHLYFPNAIKHLKDKIPNCLDEYAERTIDYFSTERYYTVLKYLGCLPAAPQIVTKILEQYAEKYIQDEKFRISLYSYLKNINHDVKIELSSNIQKMNIIPIKKQKDSGVDYISFSNNIYFSASSISTNEYFILDEDLLSKPYFNEIFDVYIKEMNEAQQKAIYEKELDVILRKENDEEKYLGIYYEFLNNKKMLDASLAYLISQKNRIPLKTISGSFRYAQLTFSSSRDFYEQIKGQIFKNIIVDKSLIHFADFLKCENISKVSFDHIEDEVKKNFTERDGIDLLNADYLPSGKYILTQCKDNGYISDDIIEKLGIGGLGNFNIISNDCEFPLRPIINLSELQRKIAQEWESNPIEIAKETVSRIESKCKNKSGNIYPIPSDDHKTHAKEMYTDSDNHDICFCQMCGKPKNKLFIEVNNIEYDPKFYWEQTRLSFCLECSKIFKKLRDNQEFSLAFIDSILKNTLEGNETESIEIPIGDKRLVFTATHFAEVQQILKLIAEKAKI